MCRFDIVHKAHVVTCSYFVVNDIYQWKTLQRSFIKKYIKYQTEAETYEAADRGSKVDTEGRPCEAEARPSQLKKCLEPRQMPSRTPSLPISVVLQVQTEIDGKRPQTSVKRSTRLETKASSHQGQCIATGRI